MNALKSYLLKAKKSILVKNFGWNIGGNLSKKIIVPLFIILTARELDPVDFGIFGVAMAVMALVNLIKDFGLKEAIIVDHRSIDFTSLQFTFQLFFSIVLYGLIFLLAPYISIFYKIDDLENAIRLLGLILLFSAIEDPLMTYYLKNNQYKMLFFRQIIPGLVFGSVALTLAYLKYGVYALIIAQILSIFASTVFLIIKSKWKPKIYFDYQIIKSLIKLGKHMILQRLSGFLVAQADSLVIGKIIGIYGLGLYQVGGKFAKLIPDSIFPQMQQVLFTELAIHKENIQFLRKRYYQFVFQGWIFSVFLSIGIFLIAPLVVKYILGQKWQEVTWIIQIFCLHMTLLPLSSLHTEISKIYGFYHIYSTFAVIRSIFTISIIIWASFHSLKLVVVSWIIVALIASISNSILFFNCQKHILFDKKLMIIFALTISYIFIVLLSVFNYI